MLQMTLQDLYHLPSGCVKVIKFAYGIWSIHSLFLLKKAIIEFSVYGFSQNGQMT